MCCLCPFVHGKSQRFFGLLAAGLLMNLPRSYSHAVHNADSKEPRREICTKEFDVLVLGAGIAGVKAAATLYDEGMRNFAVLEQSSRIGGRMWNIQWENRTIELGANWIEGIPQNENPIWKIAQDIGLEGNYTNQEDSHIKPTLYDSRGKVPEAIALPVHKRIVSALTSALNISCEHHRLGLPDISMRDALLQAGWPARDRQTHLEQTLEFFVIDWDFEYPAEEVSMFNFYDVGKAGSWHELCNITLGHRVTLKRAHAAVRLGLLHNIGFAWEPRRYFVTDPRGYAAVAEYIAKPMLQSTSYVQDSNASYREEGAGRFFAFNKTVVAIHYGQSPNWTGGSAVRVETSDGDQYCAQKCIVTFSCGVVNAAIQHRTLFYPPLPAWKSAAFAKAQIGIYTKIFLHYSTRFWDDADYILYADPIKRGYYAVWQDMESHGKFFPKNANILMVTVVQADSQRVESQSKQQTILEIQTILKLMYGPGIPEPTDIYIPKWEMNPSFGGSWSNIAKGTLPKDFALMQQEVDGVFFAGEATDSAYNGFVVGGYHSGEVVATKVVDAMREPSSDLMV